MTLTPPDMRALEREGPRIVKEIGSENVEVYLFLSREFQKGPVTQNHLFQFVFRSFYRLDNAGLTDTFKKTYFRCMEDARTANLIDLAAVAAQLFQLPTRQKRNSLQFSFVTKLANTLDSCYPIYDKEIAKVFGFRPPASTKGLDVRLQTYLSFYQQLRKSYDAISTHPTVRALTDLFRTQYAPLGDQVPAIKLIDFIFWTAGRKDISLAAPPQAQPLTRAPEVTR